jgi:HD superfamily phosphohydrolase
MSYVRKIINDPVYGFITIDDPLIFEIISHPWYQRLRRIHQMAFASLVYPGAVHTRLHHSLGAYHLMGLALQELKMKGVEITPEEETGPGSRSCCTISGTVLTPMPLKKN